MGHRATPLVHRYRKRGAGKATAEALLQLTTPYWHWYS